MVQSRTARNAASRIAYNRFHQGMSMSSWSLAKSPRAGCSLQNSDMRPEVSRIVRAAVALLRCDVAVLHTDGHTVLAAADGLRAEETARRLADPIEALALGYRSQLSVPLWRDGHRVGALAVLGRNERAFDDADIALLRALAARLNRGPRSIH